MKRTTLEQTFVLAILFLIATGAFFVKWTQANPIINVYNDVLPPEGAQAPLITIHKPLNGSSYSNDVTLAFDVAVPRITGAAALDGIAKIYYEASWEIKEIIVAERKHGFFLIDLSDMRGGNLSVTIYAVGVGYVQTGEEFREEGDVVWSYNYYDQFEMTGYSSVSFIKDVVPPRITVLSSQNTTHTSSDVALDFTVNEEAEILYCLDGKENQTSMESVTLTGLENGAHSVTLYASDLAGNAATPQTLFFKVDASESFPTSIATVSGSIATIIGVGFLVYFKKRKS